jgi:hypothetical protein
MIAEKRKLFFSFFSGVLKVFYVDKHKCTSGIHNTGLRQTCLSALETS